MEESSTSPQKNTKKQKFSLQNPPDLPPDHFIGEFDQASFNARQRLKKVAINDPEFRGRHLTQQQKTMLKKSMESAQSKSGLIHMDDPAVLITALRYFNGEIEEQHRVVQTFLQQSWTKEELCLLRDIINGKSDLDSKFDSHTFVKRKLSWKALSDSMGDQFKTLLEAEILRDPTKQEPVSLAFIGYIAMLQQKSPRNQKPVD